MFYEMIKKARDKWLLSDDCVVKNFVADIQKIGKLRDAQIEAIKTYLFLKIECENKPLFELFTNGKFNSLSKEEIESLEMSKAARETLLSCPAALCLYEYSTQKNEKGEIRSQKTADAIRKSLDKIDCEEFFKKAFYGVSYTDYLFSLPMGAGKTFLMMAFIYIDLYFALQNFSDKKFAHNFAILVPSGLKSSVIPSLREMSEFDGEWLFNKETARKIKQTIKFEVLDANKTAKKSNKTKNPNVQKIWLHTQDKDLTGLVVVTNAEKVILDSIKLDDSGKLFEDEKEIKEKEANELRYTIGKIPNLAIFIDEVHHATNDEKKLRWVVSNWAKNETVTNVLGFTGTPYLEKAEKIAVTQEKDLSVSSFDIANTVDYYPLRNAIGNFLKTPVVKISDKENSLEIIEDGIRAFFDKYKNTVYKTSFGDLNAKLGIYCGKGIDFLEEEVFPLAVKIAREYGFDSDAILKFHGGNKKYSIPAQNEKEFETLDSPLSKKRIALLCQIGKEGWNCKSLTGIILSQEGDCPTNMVLQTSCRCLRQVVDKTETALIYLNKKNGDLLESQLQQQQHISLKEFENGEKKKTRPRYDRTQHLNLPKIEFYQMKISFSEKIVKKADTENDIKKSADGEEVKRADEMLVTKNDIFKDGSIEMNSSEKAGEYVTFFHWIYKIATESLNCVTVKSLLKYENVLKEIFEKITIQKNGEIFYNEKFDQYKIRSNIRNAFYPKREISMKQEIIPYQNENGESGASLLYLKNFTNEVEIENESDFYPDETITENIIKEDAGEILLDEKTQNAINALEIAGQNDFAESLKQKFSSHPNKDRSFHYIPYRADSNFEQVFLHEALRLSIIAERGLEVYYNGDSSLTEFRIDCYKKTDENSWRRIGYYTPDFLIVKRNKDNKIEKAIIVETKGEIYANDPNFIERKKFTSDEFLKINKEKFGYKKFDYLYLEDTSDEKTRIEKTGEKIKEFFKSAANAKSLYLSE